MAITLHTIYAVDIDSVLIDQVGSQSIAPEVAESLGIGDGQLYPSFVTAGRIAPSVGFATTGLTAALGKFAPEGFPLVAANPATLFFRKRVKGGRLETGSNHIKAVVTEGIVVPRTLSADQEAAVLTSEIVPTWDGTNNPVLVTTSQALAGSPATAEKFVAGPVKINNVQLEGVTAIEVDFGIALIVPAHDGQVYPLYVAIGAIAPTITVRTVDALALSTFGIDGTAQGGTASEFYFRACQQGAKRYANDASSHIKIVNTASKGTISVREISGEQGGDAEVEIQITPASDGTTNPLSITTGTTIPGSI